MRRLLTLCALSLLLYAAIFGWLLDRPLGLGFLQQQIDAKLARAASIQRPKLVILAGSNGPYSHRCQTIEPILAMPCVNGGVAVGVGLDYVFARWRAELHRGDIVYMPMEEAQYVRSRAATNLGPDAAIMFRHDWATLAKLPTQRWLAALFAFDLRAAVMALIEAGLVATHFHDPRAEVTGTSNAWGDHVGHTAALAELSASVLRTVQPVHVDAAQVRDGYGSVLIADFIRWAQGHGITIIGGLPTTFADAPISPMTMEAIRHVYEANGGRFLILANRSLYPRGAFFDTADHLNETWQIAHSEALAHTLSAAAGGAGSSHGVARPEQHRIGLIEQ